VPAARDCGALGATGQPMAAEVMMFGGQMMAVAPAAGEP